MRILFISQLFDPEYSIKGIGLMREWVRQGHEVEVVTTYPNYPTGSIFPGYKRKLKQVEYIDGVKVVRVWSHISHSRSKLSRAATYLSFTAAALFYSFFCRRPDLLYAYHPQATTGFIGIALRSLKGVPFVTDVQDLWPDALVATGMKKNGWIVRAIDKWCRLVYLKARIVVVLSKGFQKALISRGVPRDKIRIIYNWCPEEDRANELFSATSTACGESTSPAKIVYAGNIGSAQSLRFLIEAVGAFPPSVVALKIYGNGVEQEELIGLVGDKGYKNISFMGYVQSSKIFGVLSEADILAVHLRKDPLFTITIPSKTQSSMVVGKPILMAVGGEANQIVEEYGCGVTAEPQSVESIQAAIKCLLDKKGQWREMGYKARDAYQRNFSCQVNYQRLNSLLREVSSDNARCK